MLACGLLGGALFACSEEQELVTMEPDPWSTAHATVPPAYAFLYEPAIFPENEERIRSGIPYQRIELIRTPCFGSCPVYSVEFEKDGRASYDGWEFEVRPADGTVP